MAKSAAMTETPTNSPVEFGTDEWGKWAKGVSDRLAAVEAALTAAGRAETLGKGAGTSEDRLALIERQLGISSNKEATDDPASDPQAGDDAVSRAM